ncbi:MAG: ferredoxin family protein [Thermodesulfobacteriota bacterium]|nr:ferredoxin family protein [Thermodesulfobacteriota bacterium]
MAKGEIVILDDFCKGCGLCVKFCPNDCISIPGSKISSKGYLLPVFDKQDECSACGTCGLMCPEFAIEVYRYKEKKTGTAS